MPERTQRVKQIEQVHETEEVAHDTFYHDLPPSWPAYSPEPRERQLAVLLPDGRVLSETGELFRPENWQDMADLLFLHNLQVFIGPVRDALQPWLDAISDEMRDEARLPGQEQQWCEMGWNANSQTLTGVSVHRKWWDKSGKRKCWQVRKITVSSSWARVAEASLLSDLRYTFDLLRTGVLATPGATGHATMARLWKGKSREELPKHFRPPLTLIDTMQREAIGSRRETYRPLEVFDTAYELDCTNGYASETRELPCGKPLYLADGHRELWQPGQSHLDCFTWWAKCYVRIYGPGLPLGDVAPFAVRDRDTGDLDWPTAEGGYWCWLWRFEAEEIQRRHAEEGCPMEVLSVGTAWVWLQSTTCLAEWAEYMDMKRREASQSSKARGNLVKIVIVAGIGRLGMPYESSRVRVTQAAEEEAQYTPLAGPGLPGMPLYLQTAFEDLGTPKHWQCYILSRMNFRLYQEIRAVYTSGRVVVASNVDGLVVASHPGRGVEPAAAQLGEFKVKALGDYTACPAPGVLLTREKITTPGIELHQRKRIMAGSIQRIGEQRERQEAPKGRKADREQFRRGMQAAILSTPGETDKQREALERLRSFYLRREETG